MDPKLKTATCERCKRRKIRCDGHSPCKWCDKMKATCEYEEEQGSRLGNELKKGAACLPCRRKKKKCDGQQPCRTCSTARNKVQCEYAMEETTRAQDSAPIVTVENKTSSTEEIDVVASSSSSGSSSDSPSTPPGVLPALPSFDLSDIQDPSPFVSSVEPPNYVVFADLSQARDLFLDDFGERGLTVADIPRTNFNAICAAAAEKSTDFGSDPHSPFYQPEMPEPQPSDELGKIRKLFLAHRHQLGLSVPDETLEAISRGTPGEFCLHPVLLHACQLMGYMLARHRANGTWRALPGQDEREAEQTRAALSCMRDPSTSSCPFAFMQTSCLLSLYFFNKGDMGRARAMVSHADRIMREYGLDEMARNGIPGEPRVDEGGAADKPPDEFKLSPPTQTASARAALAQIVYLDLTYAMMLGAPSVIDGQLRETFREIISVPNPDSEINFVRAKSAFLLYEAQQLADRWPEVSSTKDEPAIAAWLTSYWVLMHTIDSHRNFLKMTLTRAAFCPGLRILALSIKVSAILVLTAQATLITVFVQGNAELMEKKHEMLGEVIQISAGFGEEDCEYLEPILSACWIGAMKTLDTCIERGPEAINRNIHDVLAMARVIRERAKTLHRVLPFALEV